MDIDKIYALGRRVPKPVREIAKFGYYRLIWHDREKNAAILTAIAKCGQNYFKVFMANYLAALVLAIDEPISHHTTQKEYLPNMRDGFLQGAPYIEPHPIFKDLPISDFLFGSTTRFLRYCDGRIVFLYRNPLDFLVSYYYFKFGYWKQRSHLYSSPKEIIALGLEYYLDHYTEMRAIAKNKPILSLCYEELRRSPEATFQSAIEWYGLAVNTDALAKAVKFSDFKVMREEEERNGTLVVPKSREYTGFFMRSGKVGDWKEYFNDEDVDNVEKLLNGYDISLKDFILELPETNDA